MEEGGDVGDHLLIVLSNWGIGNGGEDVVAYPRSRGGVYVNMNCADKRRKREGGQWWTKGEGVSDGGYRSH